MTIKIITNNQSRLLMDWDELPDNERAWFDYPSAQDSSYFKYLDCYYDLGEFMRVDNIPEFAGWDGYASDTYFSGTLVKLDPDDNDRVIVGRFYS